MIRDVALEGFSVPPACLTPPPAWACPANVAYVGVDPGQHGYIAGLPADRFDVLWAEPTPTYPTGKGSKLDYDLPHVWRLVRSIPKTAYVVLERQQAYPNQGSVSNFNIGRGFMLWEMALTAAGISYETVTPRTWKGKMGIRATSAPKERAQQQKEAKARAIALAIRLFPKQDFRDKRKPCAVTLCADYAEAVLLAVFGRRHAGAA